MSINHATCKICGSLAPREVHCFPSRKKPWNEPYLATLYHKDPFFSGGKLEEYCSAVCATAGFLKGQKNE